MAQPAHEELNDRIGQVQVIPFRKNFKTSDWEVLILKRTPERGSFWQHVTGGILPGEPMMTAAYREMEEETGAHPDDYEDMVSDGYNFTFTDTRLGAPRVLTEYVAAAVMRPGFEVVMSDEHVEHRWVDPPDALPMFKYDSSREALEHYLPIITNAERGVQ